MSYLELDKVKKANESFLLSVECDSEFYLGKVGLANSYYDLGDFENARHWLIECLSKEKDNVQLMISLANSCYSLKVKN